MTPTEFIAKWRPVELKERSAAQIHFNDLCRLLYCDLTARGVGDVGVDLTKAVSLRENREVASNGISKKALFDLSGCEARSMIIEGHNPNGRKNSDVLFPWRNGEPITQRDRDMWIIHFGGRSESDADLFELPFAAVKIRVKPNRDQSRSKG